jgi:hypothetical protein
MVLYFIGAMIAYFIGTVIAYAFLGGIVGLVGGMIFPGRALEVAMLSAAGWGGAALLSLAGRDLIAALPFAAAMGVVAFCTAAVTASLGIRLRDRFTKES